MKVHLNGRKKLLAKFLLSFRLKCSIYKYPYIFHLFLFSYLFIFLFFWHKSTVTEVQLTWKWFYTFKQKCIFKNNIEMEWDCPQGQFKLKGCVIGWRKRVFQLQYYQLMYFILANVLCEIERQYVLYQQCRVQHSSICGLNVMFRQMWKVCSW